MESPTETLAYEEAPMTEQPGRGNGFLLGLGFLIAALAVAALTFTGASNTVKLVQFTAFLLLGFGYAVVVSAKLSTLPDSKQWLYTAVLTVVIAAGISAGYFFYNRFSIALVIGSACCFFLPYAMSKTRDAFSDAIGTLPAPWYYTPGMAAPQGVVSLHSTPIRMKLKVHPTDRNDKLVSFTAPGRMRIGNILFHIISEQNAYTDSKIEWADAAGEPFGWIFYRSHLGGFIKKYLQPEGSLIENSVGRNAIIVAERVIQMNG